MESCLEALHPNGNHFTSAEWLDQGRTNPVCASPSFPLKHKFRIWTKRDETSPIYTLVFSLNSMLCVLVALWNCSSSQWVWRSNYSSCWKLRRFSLSSYWKVPACVHMQLSVGVFQLHQAVTHLHLLSESLDQLCPQVHYLAAVCLRPLVSLCCRRRYFSSDIRPGEILWHPPKSTLGAGQMLPDMPL